MEELCIEALKKIELIDKIARTYKMTNEQWFINFQDKLNELSVRDPNINYLPSIDNIEGD